MKIRHPALIRSVGFLGAGAIHFLMNTVKIEYDLDDPAANPLAKPPINYIYAFWHENMLLPAYRFRNCGAAVLISKHADGEMIAGIVKRLGFGLVRGSSNKNGAKALLEMVRTGEHNHLAITPDGPRGPRRTVQAGIALLAAATGMPVVPMGIEYRRSWRAKSWDHFAVPKPFTSACLVTGPAIRVEPTTDFSALSDLRRTIESALHAVTRRAEHWRERGTFLTEPASPRIPLARAA